MDGLVSFGQNHPMLDAVIVYIGLAFVGAMPPKGTQWSKDVLYDWAYDFLHVLVNQIGAQRGQRKALPLDEKPAQ